MHRLLGRVVAVALVGLAGATAVPAASVTVLFTAGQSASQMVTTLESSWNIGEFSCNQAFGAGDTLVVSIVGGIGTREIQYIVPNGTLPNTHVYKITFLAVPQPFSDSYQGGDVPFHIFVDLDNTGDVLVPEGSSNFGDFLMVVTTTVGLPGSGGSGGLPALSPRHAAWLVAGLLGVGLVYLLRRR